MKVIKKSAEWNVIIMRLKVFRTDNYMNWITGWVKVAEILIKNGADVNHANKYGWTPLTRAARYGNN